MNNKKVLVAMSGGVDSSVAAKLMKDAGFDCAGCTMKLFENEDAGIEKSKTCCSADDAFDAETVARRLGMPFYVFNYTGEFRREVIGRFACAYLAGKTPNPCIDCNRFLKFGALMDRASVLGYDYVATGHYARIESGPVGRFRLLKGAERSKDQRYVLFSLTQQQLARLKLPLGSL
jgi:tRNA-specific 2-thiouridylase